MNKLFAEVIKNLEKNNMTGFYVERKQDVVPMLETLMEKGATVAVGGSMSLLECGAMDHLKSGRYTFLDRYAPGLSEAQVHEVFLQSLSADHYLCSTNAVTEDGILYNVDGNSNRVSAMLYGPKSVILVVGKNKIVKNLDEAVRRVKTVAAPDNAKRLGCPTFCKESGECISLKNKESELCSGCASDARICCNYVICARQRIKGRIKVILVGEPLGF